MQITIELSDNEYRFLQKLVAISKGKLSAIRLKISDPDLSIATGLEMKGLVYIYSPSTWSDRDCYLNAAGIFIMDWKPSAALLEIVYPSP